jgi:DNA-directed RNA polymerase sigma subunit (sigma70/sigma32)
LVRDTIFRLDFKDWLRSLTPRERRIIRAMARNERTKDLSRQFEVSPGRISQMRREFKEGWERFGEGATAGR